VLNDGDRHRGRAWIENQRKQAHTFYAFGWLIGVDTLSIRSLRMNVSTRLNAIYSLLSLDPAILNQRYILVFP